LHFLAATSIAIDCFFRNTLPISVCMKEFQETDTDSELLGREEAARYLRERYGFRIRAGTLQKYAGMGVCPVYRQAGRTAVYTVPALDDWAEERMSPPGRSSSDLRASA
jgi:hypothetical protein